MWKQYGAVGESLTRIWQAVRQKVYARQAEGNRR
jgi:hypothetical protein